jgi:phosphatidylglycerol---prolipoprotein diacylglyceryl transferase
LHPILFHIGSYPVRVYSLAAMAAVLAASSYSVWLGRRRGIPWAPLYSDFAVWALAGGIIGARLWEVAFQWADYREAPYLTLAVWEGGLSIQGGVIGGVTAAFLYARAVRVPFGRFIDEAVPGLLLAQAIGRLFGCPFNGDAFGRPTGTGFGLVHVSGTMAYEVYGSQPLWPAEVFEGLFDLALLAAILRLGPNRHGRPGRHFALYTVGYSAGRFLLEFLRGDTGPVLAGLTAAQLGSLAALLLGGAWLARQAGQPPASRSPA